MRVVLKECRKILNLRLLLILAVFTFVYYQIFLEVISRMEYDTYSSIGIELIKELGPTASDSVLDKKKAELIKQVDELVCDNEVLTSVGIDSLEEMKVLEEKLYDTVETIKYDDGRVEYLFSEEEEKVMEEIDNVKYSDDNESLLFKIQYIIDVMAFREDNETLLTYNSCPRSLLKYDMPNLTALIIVCMMILIIPYLIGEKLRNVLTVSIVTKEGRKLYLKQYIACILSALVVGVVQTAVYILMFIKSGLNIFWKCPMISFYKEDSKFIDISNISCGTYMFSIMALIILFVLAGISAVYWIGRGANNYIEGIAMGIIVCGWEIALAIYIFANSNISIPGIIAMVVWIVVMMGLIILRLLKERKQDILI